MKDDTDNLFYCPFCDSPFDTLKQAQVCETLDYMDMEADLNKDLIEGDPTW